MTNRSPGRRRGFAGMAEDRQRTLARQGGRAVQASGVAHAFTPEEARRGGETVSRNRQHMAEIGRKGGRASAARFVEGGREAGPSRSQEGKPMTMRMQDLRDLYVHKLQDIYDAEQQGLQAAQQLMGTVQDPQLRQGLEAHLQQTQGQVQRLEQIFGQMGEQPGGERCEAMRGLMAESQKIMGENMSPEVRDAALIAAQQAMEHYEIAGYGTARTYAQLLGEDQAAQLLEQTLQEEKQADEQLTQMAQNINVQAMES